MLRDDLRGLWYIALKDLRPYYLKPPMLPALPLSAAAFSTTGRPRFGGRQRGFRSADAGQLHPLPDDVPGRRVRAGRVAAPGLQLVARLLPLTFAVETLHVALFGGSLTLAALDLLALAGFTTVLFILAARVLAQRVA